MSVCSRLTAAQNNNFAEIFLQHELDFKTARLQLIYSYRQPEECYCRGNEEQLQDRCMLQVSVQQLLL